MTFDDWREHYALFDADMLRDEVATGPEDSSVGRFAALFVRLLDVACDTPNLSFAERLEICIKADAIGRALLSVENTEAAILATITRLETFSLSPKLAGAFREGLLNEKGVLGQTLESRTV